MFRKSKAIRQKLHVEVYPGAAGDVIGACQDWGGQVVGICTLVASEFSKTISSCCRQTEECVELVVGDLQFGDFSMRWQPELRYHATSADGNTDLRHDTGVDKTELGNCDLAQRAGVSRSGVQRNDSIKNRVAQWDTTQCTRTVVPNSDKLVQKMSS